MNTHIYAKFFVTIFLKKSIINQNTLISNLLHFPFLWLNLYPYFWILDGSYTWIYFILDFYHMLDDHVPTLPKTSMLLSLLLKTCTFFSFQIDLWNCGQDPSLWHTHFFLKEPLPNAYFFFLTCWRNGFWAVNAHSLPLLITEVDLVIQPN